jgi:hypothetical protein
VYKIFVNLQKIFKISITFYVKSNAKHLFEFFFLVYVKPKTIQNLLNMLVQLTLQFMSHEPFDNFVFRIFFFVELSHYGKKV